MTCLIELSFSSIEVGAFLLPGRAGQFSGLGCPKCTHSPGALNHLWSMLAPWTFLYLDIFYVLKKFFFYSLGSASFNFPKKMAHHFLFSYLSLALFLTFADNRMSCLVLIKRVASLLRRSYRREWETSCCQGCTML